MASPLGMLMPLGLESLHALADIAELGQLDGFDQCGHDLFSLVTG